MLPKHPDGKNWPHPMCPWLTYEEWNRLVEKDFTGAVALMGRYIHRQTLLEMGAKRVPKHRKNKRGNFVP